MNPASLLYIFSVWLRAGERWNIIALVICTSAAGYVIALIVHRARCCSGEFENCGQGVSPILPERETQPSFCLGRAMARLTSWPASCARAEKNGTDIRQVRPITANAGRKSLGDSPADA
jgi:hypothetical protein